MLNKPGLEAFLAQYGAAAVFGAVVAETFLAFLPTPPIILAAGALLVPEGASAAKAFAVLCLRVALPGAIGTAVGGLGVYWIFFVGGRPLVERFGRWFGVTWQGIVAFEKKLAKRRALLLFSSRVIPIFPTALVSAGCGVLRVEVWPFFVWSLLGAFPRWLLLGWLGWCGKAAVVHYGG